MNRILIVLRKLKFRLIALFPGARRSREWTSRPFTLPGGREMWERHHPGFYDQNEREYQECCKDPAWRALAQRCDEIGPDLIASLEARGERAEVVRLLQEKLSFRRAMDGIQLRIAKRPSPTRKDAA